MCQVWDGLGVSIAMGHWDECGDIRKFMLEPRTTPTALKHGGCYLPADPVTVGPTIFLQNFLCLGDFDAGQCHVDGREYN